MRPWRLGIVQVSIVIENRNFFFYYNSFYPLLHIISAIPLSCAGSFVHRHACRVFPGLFNYYTGDMHIGNAHVVVVSQQDPTRQETVRFNGFNNTMSVLNWIERQPELVLSTAAEGTQSASNDSSTTSNMYSSSDTNTDSGGVVEIAAAGCSAGSLVRFLFVLFSWCWLKPYTSSLPTRLTLALVLALMFVSPMIKKKQGVQSGRII